MTRSQIRSYQKKLRDKLTHKDRQAFSTAITERLIQTEEYQTCSRLFTYVSFRSEVDTHEMIQRALSSRKEVFIPRVEPQGMEFYRIRQLKGLIISSFGVPEPPAMEEDRFRPENLSEDTNTTGGNMDSHRNDMASYKNSPLRNLMLLPGLAFDPEGNRIGYGAGYYDKYLGFYGADAFFKAALAFDFQILDRIEAMEHDIKADMIITPSRIIRVSH